MRWNEELYVFGAPCGHRDGLFDATYSIPTRVPRRGAELVKRHGANVTMLLRRRCHG